MLKISSRDNPKIKFAQAVRDGKERKFIFLEGARLAEEAVRAGLLIQEIFHTANFAASARGQELLAAHPMSIAEVSDKVFDSTADTKSSQGVILIAEKPAHGLQAIEMNLAKSSMPLVLLLHQINNPTNLGAILRTAEAVDAAGIITTKNSADVFSPKALRGAMGASLRLPVWANADYYEALEWAGERNLKSICADIRSEKSYSEIDWCTGRLLIVGSEGHGLTEAERRAAAESLIIPMDNGVESLNLAVSCGVILFEAKRQKQN